jgi:GNAT superfamily N-acetyltransferase
VTRPEHREADPGDAADLARLVRELGYEATTETMRGRLEAIAEAGRAATFVAESGGVVVGFVGLRLERSYEYDDPHVRVTALAVDEGHRHEGIGGVLLERAEAWARERGALLMFLTSGAQRTEAHAFYESHGWTRTGYRFARWLDREPT